MIKQRRYCYVTIARSTDASRGFPFPLCRFNSTVVCQQLISLQYINAPVVKVIMSNGKLRNQIWYICRRMYKSIGNGIKRTCSRSNKILFDSLTFLRSVILSIRLEYQLITVSTFSGNVKTLNIIIICIVICILYVLYVYVYICIICIIICHNYVYCRLYLTF